MKGLTTNMEKPIKIIKDIFDSMNLTMYHKSPDQQIDMDSLTMIQLVLNLELAFDFEFDLDELDFDKFKNFNEILKMVIAKMKKKDDKNGF